MKQYIVLIYIGLLSLPSVCQEYSWQAELDSVTVNGFHQILIEPDVTARLRPGYPDLRLLDENGQQQAYIMRHEKLSEQWTNFVEYDILSKDYHYTWWDDDKYVIDIGSDSVIEYMVLKVANFIDTRYVYLSGSYDTEQWYVIQDGYTLHNIVSENREYQYKVLKFPKSRYRYYKIVVSDHWHDDPINILAMGYFKDEVKMGKYSEVVFPNFTQTDSVEAKQSIIDIPLNSGNYFDKLVLDIGGANLFHRRVKVYNKVPNSDTTFRLEKVKDMWVSSTHLNEIYFHKLHSYGFKLIIYNNDDIPLILNNIKYLQLNSYLVSELHPDRQYTLAFGHDTVPAPVYDLKYFENEIAEELPYAYIRAIKKVPIAIAEEVEEEVAFYEEKAFVWVVVIAIGLVLAYMSTRMLAEMKSNG